MMDTEPLLSPRETCFGALWRWLSTPRVQLGRIDDAVKRLETHSRQLDMIVETYDRQLSEKRAAIMASKKSGDMDRCKMDFKLMKELEMYRKMTLQKKFGVEQHKLQMDSLRHNTETFDVERTIMKVLSSMSHNINPEQLDEMAAKQQEIQIRRIQAADALTALSADPTLIVDDGEMERDFEEFLRMGEEVVPEKREKRRELELSLIT